MASAGSIAGRAVGEARAAWRVWNFEQKTAAVAATLLIVSTFGPFSFVELAVILVAGGVLWLLKSRADGKRFHLPFGDGTVILAAGIWSALLIVVRLFDRPLGQNLLALTCAGILALAGLLERAKRPADDLPEEPTAEATASTRPVPPDAAPTQALPPTGPATPAARRAGTSEAEELERGEPPSPDPNQR
jgi:hypothetical protein